MAKQKRNNTAVKVGLGVAAVSAMALGAYYLYGAKDSAKNRKKVKAWMLKAKGEVLDQVEKAKELSLEAYNNAVETVAAKYKNMPGISPLDIAAFVKELKRTGKSASTKTSSPRRKTSKSKTKSKSK